MTVQQMRRRLIMDVIFLTAFVTMAVVAIVTDWIGFGR